MLEICLFHFVNEKVKTQRGYKMTCLTAPPPPRPAPTRKKFSCGYAQYSGLSTSGRLILLLTSSVTLFEDNSTRHSTSCYRFYSDFVFLLQFDLVIAVYPAV